MSEMTRRSMIGAASTAGVAFLGAEAFAAGQEERGRQEGGRGGPGQNCVGTIVITGLDLQQISQARAEEAGVDLGSIAGGLLKVVGPALIDALAKAARDALEQGEAGAEGFKGTGESFRRGGIEGVEAGGIGVGISINVGFP